METRERCFPTVSVQIFLAKDSEHMPSLGHMLIPGPIPTAKRRGECNRSTYLTRDRRRVLLEEKGEGGSGKVEQQPLHPLLFQNIQ